METQRKAVLHKIGKKTGLICCSQCSRELGKLEWLKKRNTVYFINNQEFLKTNECQLKDTYKNFQENLIMGKYLCHFCSLSNLLFQEMLNVFVEILLVDVKNLLIDLIWVHYVH